MSSPLLITISTLKLTMDEEGRIVCSTLWHQGKRTGEGWGRQCMEWPQGKSFSHPIHPDELTSIRRSKKSKRKGPINYLFLRLKPRSQKLKTNLYRSFFLLPVGRFLLRGRRGWQIWRIGVVWGQRNCQSWSTVIPYSFVKTPLNLLKAKASSSFLLYLQGLAQITPNPQSVLC